MDVLQYKDLLKNHRAFDSTLTCFTVRHGGSIAIKGVTNINMRVFACSPCFTVDLLQAKDLFELTVHFDAH